jgi:hypothetical protein
MTEWQIIIDLVGGAILASMGWFGRVLWEAVGELRKDLHAIEVELPTSYVRREEFSAAIDRIEKLCGKIFDKLDDKADK